MPQLSVIILCGQSPRHLYFANQLSKAYNVQAIIQEGGHDAPLKKIIHLLQHPTKLWRKICRWLRDRKRYTGNKEAKFFFNDSPAQLDRQDLRQEVPHINHPDVIQIIEKHNPDLIAVFGTSLIKGELLNKGRLGIINLHGGLSPEYRGADCTFWALYNEEPEKVGCTLHYINAGIDTGNIIAHVSPEIKDNDDELSLFWRAVQDSTDTFVELLDRLKNEQMLGSVQTDKGSLYQVKDRALNHEKKLDTLLQNGLLKNLNLSKRVVWF
ncbi:MAG: formyl transferase [Methylomarinum sp.]|nr:formyl transferase [Methylomarinum sp.]